MHTFTWLNLLLEPKRHLQRFGFVFLGTGVSLECKGSGWQAGERRPGRGDAACSPRTSRGESFGCKHFSKKFVIDCHWAHTFTWLNLLLEPKRHLQRFGFVFLGDASFGGFSDKGQERWEDMSERAFLSLPRKKILKIFCHRCHGHAYR